MLYPFDLKPDGLGTKETISPPSGKNVKSGFAADQMKASGLG
ncbi:hypothetical protein [Mesorhizobium sp. M0589]